jgi:fructoselysine-6-P-deglycase FrlB-like protein
MLRDPQFLAEIMKHAPEELLASLCVGVHASETLLSQAEIMVALRHAKEQKARVLAICNTNGSTIPRESDGVIYTHAGPEIGVASTKGFLTQLVACYLLGLYLAQVREAKSCDEIGEVLRELVETNTTHAFGSLVRMRCTRRRSDSVVMVTGGDWGWETGDWEDGTL